MAASALAGSMLGGGGGGAAGGGAPGGAGSGAARGGGFAGGLDASIIRSMGRATRRRDAAAATPAASTVGAVPPATADAPLPSSPTEAGRTSSAEEGATEAAVTAAGDESGPPPPPTSRPQSLSRLTGANFLREWQAGLTGAPEGPTAAYVALPLAQSSSVMCRIAECCLRFVEVQADQRTHVDLPASHEACNHRCSAAERTRYVERYVLPFFRIASLLLRRLTQTETNMSRGNSGRDLARSTDLEEFQFAIATILYHHLAHPDSPLTKQAFSSEHNRCPREATTPRCRSPAAAPPPQPTVLSRAAHPPSSQSGRRAAETFNDVAVPGRGEGFGSPRDGPDVGGVVPQRCERERRRRKIPELDGPVRGT